MFPSFHRYCTITLTTINKGYMYANLTNIFPLNISPKISSPCWWLSTFHYFYLFMTLLGLSFKPVDSMSPITTYGFS
ncbi:hypothetical protein COL82_18070 [Bacillus toyonensis]|nr:hypothetical protein COL82_18070 [Bacillus toyonensis]PHB28021.1 hypothetical protein COE88_04090 [Bacillus toyonensis]